MGSAPGIGTKGGPSCTTTQMPPPSNRATVQKKKHTHTHKHTEKRKLDRFLFEARTYCVFCSKVLRTYCVRSSYVLCSKLVRTVLCGRFSYVLSCVVDYRTYCVRRFYLLHVFETPTHCVRASNVLPVVETRTYCVQNSYVLCSKLGLCSELLCSKLVLSAFSSANLFSEPPPPAKSQVRPLAQSSAKVRWNQLNCRNRCPATAPINSTLQNTHQPINRSPRGSPLARTNSANHREARQSTRANRLNQSSRGSQFTRTKQTQPIIERKSVHSHDQSSRSIRSTRANRPHQSSRGSQSTRTKHTFPPDRLWVYCIPLPTAVIDSAGPNTPSVPPQQQPRRSIRYTHSATPSPTPPAPARVL